MLKLICSTFVEEGNMESENSLHSTCITCRQEDILGEK